jgi:hypothetical protein
VKRPALKHAITVLFGLIGLFWFAMSLVALVAGITGHNVLFEAATGSVVLPPLSLLGKVYVVTSGILPFVVLGVIASA